VSALGLYVLCDVCACCRMSFAGQHPNDGAGCFFHCVLSFRREGRGMSVCVSVCVLAVQPGPPKQPGKTSRRTAWSVTRSSSATGLSAFQACRGQVRIADSRTDCSGRLPSVVRSEISSTVGLSVRQEESDKGGWAEEDANQSIEKTPPTQYDPLGCVHGCHCESRGPKFVLQSCSPD
jgi:hypothetical protein